MTDPTDKPAPPKHGPPPIDEELERERLEPGPNTAGKGDVGAAPGGRKGHENSNT